MSLLVYVYSMLKEASLLGHTTIGFDEINMNPGRSNAGRYQTPPSHSKKTKSARFVICVLMDQLESLESAVNENDRTQEALFSCPPVQ